MLFDRIFGKTDKAVFQSKEWRRFQWTVGLFFIGLIVPVTFLTPRIIEQAEFPSFLDLFILFSSILIGFICIFRIGIQQISLIKQQKKFVSAVSHELKTPLTSIRMFVEMLESGRFDSPEKRKQCCQYMLFETDRLQRLVDNVLSLANISNASLNIELQEVPVGKIIEKTALISKPLVRKAGFELKISQDSSINPAARIPISEDYFLRIFINLIDNALKYSKGVEKKLVELGYRQAENRRNIVFFVRDYGPGIEVSEREGIFELFQRGVKASDTRTSGCGIGLALVKEMSAAMGATVAIVSREPGLEFQVSFLYLNPFD